MTAKKGSEDPRWTQPLTHEEHEAPKEEPKEEPIEVPVFVPVGGSGELTHLQEGSILRVSIGLPCTPPPPPPLPTPEPLLLQPKKEEEEAVEISRRRGEGGPSEDGGKTGEMAGQVERGTVSEIEVEVPGSDSDEETLMDASTPPEVTDDVTYKESSASSSLLEGRLSDEVTCGRSLLWLQSALRRTVMPAHWVAVLADGPPMQLQLCSKLSSMADIVIHVQPDLCVFITVRDRLLPDTHSLYRTHIITHLSQLVSLLEDLERLVICRGSRVRSHAAGLLEVRSPTCHLLVSPPCLTCPPCLQEVETKMEDDGDEGWGEVRVDELSGLEPACPSSDL